MNTGDPSNPGEPRYQCPVCGNAVPRIGAVPRFDALCCACGADLWCRRRVSSGDAVLEASPGRTPEPWEVERVLIPLAGNGGVARVILDLSDLECVSSAFVARLITMNKRIRSSGGQFYLSGLRPVVLALLQRLRLDTVFDIVDS
jgi:anti-anti-sigma factor